MSGQPPAPPSSTDPLQPTPASPVLLSVAYPYAPIGPEATGGAEVICSQIEAALPGLGFRSVVVAHAESQPRGTLYPVEIPDGLISDQVRELVERNLQAALDRVLAEQPVALIHMHGLDFHRYRLPDHIPVLVTLHLPPAWYPRTIWDLPARIQFVCVSHTERQACPQSVQHRILVVENGVPLPNAASLRAAGHYALLLSRICEEKNVHTGLAAAELAGMPALLAGRVFPYAEHQQYFEREIQPRLTHSGNAHEQRSFTSGSASEARFLGPVTGRAKDRLIARAACLLLPSLAPETSSLVAMEALAAGVPVIGMASGAVPEIVDDGRTGFLIHPGADAPASMAAAMRRLPSIDRRECRATAEQRFNIDRMLPSYRALYQQLARPVPSTLPPIAPSPALEVRHGVPKVIPRLIPSVMPGRNPDAIPRLEHIEDTQRFASLAPEWLALWQADPHATPFQHPAWLLPWWRQFGPEGELHAFALREQPGGDLLGLLPLYVYQQPDPAERQLLLIGAGTTDYLDGLWRPDLDAVTLATAALASVLTGLPNWDRLHLAQLREASPLLQAAQNLLPGQDISIFPAESCSVLRASEPLPARVGANLRRYQRRAASAGTLNTALAETEPAALILFDQLVTLHGERWHQRGDSGVLSDPRVIAHHREAIPKLLTAGLLRLFRLTLNNETLGVLYTLADPPTRTGRSLYLYLIGFDTRFAELSPGSLLLHAVWEYARAHGFTHLDLLRGGESYKHLWGSLPKPTFALTAHRQPIGDRPAVH